MKLKYKKNIIKIRQIFRAHWSYFIKENGHKIPDELYEDVVEVVEKMLGCGDPRNGFAEYWCLTCHGEERRIVPFTCKSRFCPSCGKVYVDKWVEKTVGLLANVSHRHPVFTIPEQFRGYVYWNRALIKDLSDISAEVVLEVIKGQNRELGIIPGVITVVHTFGRDIGFNPHIHALVSEGGLDRYKVWRDIGYLPYESLRKKWQYKVLTMMRERLKGEKGIGDLIDKMFREYKNGFYVYAEKRLKDGRGAARYIGRYLARPPLAEYRILEYDGENVKFWYEDHETKKKVTLSLPVFDFIGRLMMHIPKKGFMMVRRYGLYRRGIAAKMQKIVSLWRRPLQTTFDFLQEMKERLNWRQRLIRTYKEDPIRCKRCGDLMELWRIWHPKYGDIYDLSRDSPSIEEVVDVKEDERSKERFPQEAWYAQLCLFSV